MELILFESARFLYESLLSENLDRCKIFIGNRTNSKLKILPFLDSTKCYYWIITLNIEGLIIEHSMYDNLIHVKNKKRDETIIGEMEDNYYFAYYNNEFYLTINYFIDGKDGLKQYLEHMAQEKL